MHQKLHTFYGLLHTKWAALTGGLFDGENQIPAAVYAGDAYEGRFSTSVVINGVLYYNTAGTRHILQQSAYLESKQLTYTQAKNFGS